jgi:hypothetical protein
MKRLTACVSGKVQKTGYRARVVTSFEKWKSKLNENWNDIIASTSGFLQGILYLLQKSGHIMLNCMPDQVEVNPKVFMYQLVSHARNGFPVDLRIKGLELW